jgi:ElaB/YqjD/DUF883 family membrane-anchored ribosome-binding protein
MWQVSTRRNRLVLSGRKLSQVRDGTVKMAAVKPASLTEVQDIQRRMAQIRREMHADVQGAVKSAQSLTDWRGVVRSHPWMSLGVAAFAGYLIVPRRPATSLTTPPIAVPVPQAAAAIPRRQPMVPTRGSAWRTFGTVFSLLAPVVVRAAQNHASHWIEKRLADNPLPGAEMRAASRSSSGGFRSVDLPRPPTHFRDQRSG